MPLQINIESHMRIVSSSLFLLQTLRIRWLNQFNKRSGSSKGVTEKTATPKM